MHGYVDPKTIAAAEADLIEMRLAFMGSIKREVLMPQWSGGGATWVSDPQYPPRAGSAAAAGVSVSNSSGSSNCSNIIGSSLQSAGSAASSSSIASATGPAAAIAPIGFNNSYNL